MKTVPDGTRFPVFSPSFIKSESFLTIFIIACNWQMVRDISLFNDGSVPDNRHKCNHDEDSDSYG